MSWWRQKKAVEHLLMLLRERHPPRECWRQITGDRASRTRCSSSGSPPTWIQGAAASLARAGGGAEGVWVAREGGQSLRPHLLAALLTASLNGTHPLHAAACPPGLLERLDALATARDTSAPHARRRPAPPLTAEQLLTVVSTVYDAVEALHGMHS
ncbi:hypothetical protein ACN28I_28130 [Archangium gephyra]|uniref:hypothetical protein n=1 Tax=Archangium gephyra TaxID=48 RepID=UPI003B769727